MTYIIPGLFIIGLLFVIYRTWQAGQSDRILAQSGLQADEKKKTEYDEQKAQLDKEVEDAETRYACIKLSLDGKQCPATKPSKPD